MPTNALHLHSAYLPLWILIVGGIFMLAALLLRNNGYWKIARGLMIAGAVLAFLTGGMGGASMGKTENLPDINLTALKHHAWTAAVSIICFLILSVLTIRRIRNNRAGKNSRPLDIMLLVTLILVSFFLGLTIHVAHQIRL